MLASLLPQGFSVNRRHRSWWVEHPLVPLRRLSVGETTYLTLPPRCELGEHFGQGIIADARIIVHGSMFPYSTTAHACRTHTPTPASIVAHNAAHHETVESIQITDLISEQVIATWPDQPADTN
ncbi:hypothetical protein GPX89_25670 [Nocardia sp. ET3-3]|uniref:Uncharacterized protein n=1 Tax=Nocardia terrae TaxID=2675851 RepID=A0A7K1V1W6_9NOCA|nr:hypothetical protein [Nocardia terrae]MVU80626.1 hypothetical protein [Nocardia terrae]